MKIKILIILLVLLSLVGCATAPPVKGRSDLLNFLTDGKTRKEEVLTTLGQPSGQFESQKILTYRLGYEPKSYGYYVVERESTPSGWPMWTLTQYSLVLVFDDAGVLEKQSLIKVNK